VAAELPSQSVVFSLSAPEESATAIVYAVMASWLSVGATQLTWTPVAI